MKRKSHLMTSVTLCAVIAFALSFPFTYLKAVPAESQNGQGGQHRNDVCDDLPDPSGNAFGIERKCPDVGSSSGIAKGDFNGDGIGDLAIGAPGEDLSRTTGFGENQQTTNISNAGAVHVIYGTAANGLVASPSGVAMTNCAGTTAFVPSTQFPTQRDVGTDDRIKENGDKFGSTVVSGDFDGDCFSDLAVGIPGETTSGSTAVGAVEIFKGGTNGLQLTSVAFFGPATFTAIANPQSSHGATSLAWGDFDHDGRGDLAVASDYSSDLVNQTGAVTVLFGTQNGLSTANKRHIALETMTISASRPSVRLVLVAGDFDGNDFSDLAVGSPWQSVDLGERAGRVFVLYSSSVASILSEATKQVWSEDSDGIEAGTFFAEQFGTALAVGDFNGDAFDDLAISAPGEFINSADGDIAVGCGLCSLQQP